MCAGQPRYAVGSFQLLLRDQFFDLPHRRAPKKSDIPPLGDRSADAPRANRSGKREYT
jgi:hypothetical protein